MDVRCFLGLHRWEWRDAIDLRVDPTRPWLYTVSSWYRCARHCSRWPDWRCANVDVKVRPEFADPDAKSDANAA